MRFVPTLGKLTIYHKMRIASAEFCLLGTEMKYGNMKHDTLNLAYISRLLEGLVAVYLLTDTFV